MPETPSHPIVDAAKQLFALVRAEAPAGEEARTLTRPVVDALLAARLFDMNVPAAIGGPEVDGRTYLQAIEEVARADGSAGWCVMIAAETNGQFGAYLPLDIARALLIDDGPIGTAGSLVPVGSVQLERTPEGDLLSGQWRFASGCRHASYVFGIAPLVRDGVPVLHNGRPQMAGGIARQSDVEILDNWRVAGLRATGSNDFRADRVRVQHTWELGHPPHQPTTMFRLPGGAFLAMGKAAVSMGIARGAIDEFVENVAGKTPAFGAAALRDEPRIQVEVADAEATLRSARAFLFEEMQDAWDTAASGQKVSQRQAATLRLASVHAARASARAVELMYHAAGATSLFESSPIQRAMRDVHAVRQHMNVSDRFRQDAGRVLLGLPPKEPIF